MGVAAYNRGSLSIRRSFDSETRPVEFDIMDRLNEMPKYPDAGTPFGPIDFVPSHNGYFAECPVTGFGFWYPTLAEAVKRWRVQIIGLNNGTWSAKP